MIAFAVDIRIRVDQFVVLGRKPILPSGDLQLLIAESPLAVLGCPGRFCHFTDEVFGSCVSNCVVVDARVMVRAFSAGSRGH